MGASDDFVKAVKAAPAFTGVEDSKLRNYYANYAEFAKATAQGHFSGIGQFSQSVESLSAIMGDIVMQAEKHAEQEGKPATQRQQNAAGYAAVLAGKARDTFARENPDLVRFGSDDRGGARPRRWFGGGR